jgi:hypothetical protein
MRNQKNGKTRSDRPSGRQASEQPEHTSNPATESLHQGQGPDLISQDKRVQEENPGVNQLNKNLGFQQAGKPHQQPLNMPKESETEEDRSELSDREGD